MINIVKYSKLYFIFSGILILVSLFFVGAYGLKPGIEFSGGSILELEYINERPANEEIKEILASFELGDTVVQPTEEKAVIIRMKDINENLHQEIVQKLEENHEIEEKRFESIGPVIGEELKEKTTILIILSLIVILIYVTFAFRKVQRPIKSWQYGIATLIALGHDVLIPIGVFAILGQHYGVEITIPIIVALLTVLGYSVNDTVVVFDRIRENLIRGIGDNLEDTINRSLNQTITRSVNTSLTTLIVLSAIFFLGGATLKYFALALIIGIIAGTYSSIFLAPLILISWIRRQERKKAE